MEYLLAMVPQACWNLGCGRNWMFVPGHRTSGRRFKINCNYLSKMSKYSLNSILDILELREILHQKLCCHDAMEFNSLADGQFMGRNSQSYFFSSNF